MIKSKTSNFNYGRFDWKMEYPKNREEIKSLDDDTLIKYYRFLPPALGNKYKAFLLSDIVSEVKRRFNSTSLIKIQ